MISNLNDILKPARERGYAVGLFNTCSLELARGVLEAAEELQSPVIIGTAEVLLPLAPLEMVADMLLPMADRASVPVAVHLDHGLTEETCRRALELGFSSIMFDCSTETYDRNAERVAAMADLAHSYGVTLEAELGHVGDNEGEDASGDPARYYTDPEEARDFVDRTGADALAIAVGTAHGAYRLPPQLDFDRIRVIRETVDVPLVLHGGSGLADADFRRAIEAGISKVNIFTDINHAAGKAAYDTYASGGTLLTDQQPAIVDAVRTAALEKMRLFLGREE